MRRKGPVRALGGLPQAAQRRSIEPQKTAIGRIPVKNARRRPEGFNGGSYHENELVGRTLHVGERLRIAVLERDPRCKMITLDPDTGREEPRVLRHVTKSHDGMAGVYAAVLVEGWCTRATRSGSCDGAAPRPPAAALVGGERLPGRSPESGARPSPYPLRAGANPSFSGQFLPEVPRNGRYGMGKC